MKLIANPRAGAGKVGREWEQTLATLRGVFPALEAVQTEAIGHAAELARAAVAEGHTEVLSLGGDGTHSEVAQGLAASGAPAGTLGLGVLHGGTGGDFSRLLGRGTLDEQARRLRDVPAAPIDLGRVRYEGGERVFLNEVSFGISADVCEAVNRAGKGVAGRYAFFGSLLSALTRFRAVEVEVVVDGKVLGSGRALAVLVGNGRWAGGGMPFTPDARLADGQFDVIAVWSARVPSLVRSAAHLYDGRLGARSHCQIGRGRVVELRTGGVPFGIEADGEVLGSHPHQVEVLPGAIRLLGAPAQWL